jgi:hypothetical protein
MQARAPQQRQRLERSREPEKLPRFADIAGVGGFSIQYPVTIENDVPIDHDAARRASSPIPVRL